MESGSNCSYNSIKHWKVFGHNIPKAEVVFFSQTIILYILIISCLINLSFGIGDQTIFTSILCSSVGYMLPSPSIQKSGKIIEKIRGNNHEQVGGEL